MDDPNPRVSGRGADMLRAAGLKVASGVLAERARALNLFYLRWIRTGRPYVILKLAMTLDGRVALEDGRSQWITSEMSRRRAHKWRGEVDGVLVGVNTVIADDPRLDARLARKRPPVKIVLDSHLRIPADAQVFGGATLYLITTDAAPAARRAACARRGAEVIVVPSDAEGRPEIDALVRALGEREITSVLIEGGPTVAASALRAGIVDEVRAFVAPKLLGRGLGAVGDLGVGRLEGTFDLHHLSVRRIGPDVLIRGRMAED